MKCESIPALSCFSIASHLQSLVVPKVKVLVYCKSPLYCALCCQTDCIHSYFVSSCIHCHVTLPDPVKLSPLPMVTPPVI